MVVIGVTGSVGSGKSTVARCFQQLGAVVLDADAIARDLLQPQRAAWRDVTQVFGKQVLRPDRTIDRRILASIVFRDPRRRRVLERIIHPRVLRIIRQRLGELRRARNVRAIVLDVPLLLEVGAETLVDVVIVVTAPEEVQRARLKAAVGWSHGETTARMRAQWNLSAKVALADYVVDNSDGVEATRTQVRRIWNQLGRCNRRSSTSRP